MPRWYYDKKDLRNTPSISDGVEFEGERRYRVEGARFIMHTGTSMSLGHNTIATGIVYFHRFYMFHSFRTFPRYVTACCCLFLAGKVEETPKKCKDIIRIAKNILSDQKFQSFGDDPKEEVMTLERILLQTIKFDLQVDHPYSFLLRYAKCLKGDSVKIQKMVQMAWNFVNDSLSTTLSLQWEPEIIAVALIYLACKLSKFNVIDWTGRLREHIKWWDMFVQDVTMDVLEDICHQVLDLYQQPISENMPESPPQLPPSKASPPAKRAKFIVPHTPSPSTSSLIMKMSSAAISVASSIPVKVSSNEAEMHMMPKIAQPSLHYGYPSTSGYSMYSQPPMPSVAQHNPPLPTSYSRPPLPAPPPMPGPSSSSSYHHRPSPSTSSHYYSQQQQQQQHQHPHQPPHGSHSNPMSYPQYSNHPSSGYYRAPPPSHQPTNHPPHHRTNNYYRHHQ